ncbi:AraC family transcriptional regulator [Salipiger mucosus]|nr:AraC family transcriptional regulator [Salipiger mucosus]
MRDTLTSVFQLLDLHSARSTRLEAGGAWSLRFPDRHVLKFAAVTRGGCWMLHPEHPEVELRAGDAFLLCHTPSYVLASDRSLPPENGAEVIDWSASDTGRYGGDEVALLAGAFAVSALHERVIHDALPRLMLLRRETAAAAAIMRTLELMEVEFQAARMGASLMRHHLAEMLLVQMLRAHASAETVRGGWISTLTDPKLGAALGAIHGAPERHWTLRELAGIAGMSRSAFAQAFQRALGRTPIDYAAHWRMQVAEDLLARGLSVTEVSDRMGYSTQSAFGAAYKRIRGQSPGAVTRRAEARP